MQTSAAYSPTSLNVSSEEEAVVTDVLREFGNLQIWRNVHAEQWEETSALILPSYRNTFFYGGFTMPGAKKTEQQVDATGMMALSRFAAIMDSLSTPRNQVWHALGADAAYLMKDRKVRLWYEDTTRILFQQRYAPHANFSSQNQAMYQSLGAFGTGPMFVDDFDGGPGVRYSAGALGEWYIKQNHQGIVCGFIRWFRLTAEQAIGPRGKWPGKQVPAMQTALAQHNQMFFNFLHRVEERGNYDPQRWDAKGKKYSSQYVCIEGKCMMQEEGGYRTFPLMAARYEQAPIEVYGRGPATMVLPSLKTLNAQKRVFLKQGHRAADPVLLGADDGLIDFQLRPGAFNKGAVNRDGRPMVHVLPTGDIQITKEQMELEKSLVNDAFLVTLFQILTETPQMSATEVIERTNEKGILIAPTAGRLQSEYLGPLIDRELDVLASQRLIPPMPPLLREAKGAYSVTYTSPLARAARSQEAAGFMRTVEHGKELIAVTQDVSILDPLNMDAGIRGIAEIQGVPASWMATDDEVKGKQKNRAKQQQLQAQIQAMPAQAAMIKAQAVASEKGGGQEQQGAPQ